MLLRKFECIKDCSDCCINRQYYPSVEYGKIGVLILPEEKERVEGLARKNHLDVKIIPRIGVGKKKGKEPSKVIAYQMMGKNQDGTLCPFLDVESTARAPHGSFKCKIYNDRPLACRAYPVIDLDEGKAMLDDHCRFCSHHSTTTASSDSLQSELEALARIKQNVNSDQQIWRYATAVGDEKDKRKMLAPGWVIQ